MVTNRQGKSVPTVEEQSLLNTPIKVEWWHKYDSRQKFKERAVGVRLSDRDPDDPQYEMMGVSYRCFERQKSNIVVKTEEELGELVMLLEGGYTDGHYSWNNTQMMKKFRKVRGELRQEAGRRKLDIDNIQRRMR